MKYLSVCSGIEAASVAWHRLGWTPIGFSEIEPFPSAVLAHRFPDVPNFGDMTKFQEWPIEPGTIDVLVGGTPCQSFSVAGLRAGLADSRGGLMLTYLEIARRFRPRWVVWENVPGVLSSDGGRALGTFLGALGELGYGWAYRVLDAQWCRTHGHPRAVPQRRRRVFVVGCLGDWSRAAKVLFERESVQRDSSARRTQGQGAAADAEAGAGAGCWWDGSECAGTLTKQNANGAQRMPDKDNFGAVLQPVAVKVADALVAKNNQTTGFQTEVCAQPVPYDLFQITAPVNRQNRQPGDPCHTLARDNAAHAAVVNMQGSKSNACVSTDGSSFTLNAMHGHDVHAVAFQGGSQQDQILTPDAVVPTLAHASNSHGGHHQPKVWTTAPTLTAANDPSRSPQSSEVTQQVAAVHAASMIVRRLTPRECERLQGFPDDYTAIPWRKKPADECPDGPRYKALGNSMAVNCMAWIGERIAEVSK